jgi:hypothetical protein
VRLAARSVLAAAAVVALLGACTSSGHATSASPTSASPTVDPFLAVEPLGCLPPGAQAERIGQHGARTIVAWSAPRSTKGVVLAPQLGDSACEWAQEWVKLRDEGYVVASFDWGPDDSDSMRAAANKLRSLGVKQLALVGASKGGTFAAAMADELHAVAVVSLSPPSVFGVADAEATRSAYHGPLLVYASQDDRNVPPADSRLVAHDASQFQVFPGDAHGVGLLSGQYNKQVQAGIDATLQAGFGG